MDSHEPRQREYKVVWDGGSITDCGGNLQGAIDVLAFNPERGYIAARTVTPWEKVPLDRIYEEKGREMIAEDDD